MLRVLLALAFALLPLMAGAQPQRVGPLDARNNLGEINASGPAARAAARSNLGIYSSMLAADVTTALGYVPLGVAPNSDLIGAGASSLTSVAVGSGLKIDLGVLQPDTSVSVKTSFSGPPSTDNPASGWQDIVDPNAAKCLNGASLVDNWGVTRDAVANYTFGSGATPSSLSGSSQLYVNIGGETVQWLNYNATNAPCGYTPRWQSGTVSLGYSLTDGSIRTGSIAAGGSGYVDSVYTAVPLTGGAAPRAQAKANITVSGGVVTAVAFEQWTGIGYVVGDVLSADAAGLGGSGSGFAYTVDEAGKRGGQIGGLGIQQVLEGGDWASVADIDGYAYSARSTSFYADINTSSKVLTNLTKAGGIPLDPVAEGWQVGDLLRDHSGEVDDRNNLFIPGGTSITAFDTTTVTIDEFPLQNLSQVHMYERQNSTYFNVITSRQGHTNNTLQYGYDPAVPGTDSVRLGVGVQFRRMGNSADTFIDGSGNYIFPRLPARSVVISGGAAISTSAAPGTAGNCLKSNGASVDPSFQACNSAAAIVAVPNAGHGSLGGYVPLEAGATNIVWPSTDLTSVQWTGTNASAASSATVDPFGGTTAALLTSSDVGGYIEQSRSFSADTAVRIGSAYFLASSSATSYAVRITYPTGGITATATYVVSTGAVTLTGTPTAGGFERTATRGDGSYWIRVWIAAANPSATAVVTRLYVNGTTGAASSAVIAAPQTEVAGSAGNVPTAYVPTVSAAATETGGGRIRLKYMPTAVVPLTGTTGSIGGGALAAGACASGTATVTGVASSMALIATPVADAKADASHGLSVIPWMSATDTVTVDVCAIAATTPTARAWNVRAIP